MTLTLRQPAAIADRAAVEAAAGHRAALVDHGYVIIRGLVPAIQIRRFGVELNALFGDCPASEGHFYGFRTKRFGKLLTRTQGAAPLVMHPTILGIVEPLLLAHCDNMQLNLTQAIQITAGEAAQLPHRDEEMWGGPKGTMEYLVNVIWPTGAFTAGNGATRIWPRRSPAQAEPVIAEMVPGDVMLFLGSTLHGGGANMNGVPRSAFLTSYCLGWLKPFENQWLSYPPAVASGFPEPLAALVGYRQHRPNLGNVDGRCPSELFKGETAVLKPATDALTDAQAAALAGLAAAGAAA